MKHILLLVAAALALPSNSPAQIPNGLRHSIPAPFGSAQQNGSLGYAGALDGNYAVLGAPLDDIGGTDCGVVKVFDATTGALLHVLVNPSPAGDDQFGKTVAISGTRVVVGAINDDTGATNSGSAYVYDLASATPTVPVATLNNPGPAPKANDHFGCAVAISGTMVVVGADGDDTGAGDAGCAYVYDLAGGTPTIPTVTLNNPAPEVGDGSGITVAITGNCVAVGMPGDNTGFGDAGEVYLYNLGGATPVAPVATLSDPAGKGLGDMYGSSVAISGTRLIVGASSDDLGASGAGNAHVYDVTDPANPAWIVTLHNPAPAANDLFGWSVGISQNRVVVGALGDDTDATNAGIAYFYDLTNGTPSVPVAIVKNPTPAVGENFGRAVAISGLRVLISSPIDSLTAPGAGSAYMYDFASGQPNPSKTLNNPGPSVGDNFGRAIGLSGGLLVVGAPGRELVGTDMGRAYVFDLTSANSTAPVAVLQNPTQTPGDEFGKAVAIFGSRVVVTAPSDDAGAANAGAAYVYEINGNPAPSPTVVLRKPTPMAQDQFGTSVAMDGTKVVVGVPNEDGTAFEVGGAYVFDLGNETPTVPIASLSNPESAQGSRFFGSSVAISGMRVAVLANTHGAYVYDLGGPEPLVPVLTVNNSDFTSFGNGKGIAINGTRVVVGAASAFLGASNSGKAYVYDLTSAVPTAPVATLNNPTPAQNDVFGSAVEISDAWVVVGAKSDDGSVGIAYVYDFRSGPTNTPAATLKNPSPMSGDSFGYSLAIDGTTVAVGAAFDDDVLWNKGSAFVFEPDQAAPIGGTFVLTPSPFAKPGFPVTATFSGWTDASLPLTYSVRMGNSSIVAPGENAAPTFAMHPGTYQIYGRITDAHGNFVDTAEVTLVVDGVKPVITVPENITLEATGPAGMAVNFVVSATDDLDPNPSLVVTPASGSVFPIGGHNVNVTATDAAGNIATRSFSVTVRDTIAPSLTGTFSPRQLVAGTPWPDYIAQAIYSDAVGVVSVTQTPAPGSPSTPGVSTVTITARDAANNENRLTFRVGVGPVNPTASILLSKGAEVPASAGLDAGSVWTSFGVPAVNENGDVAFFAKWANGDARGEGVWVRRGESGLLETVVTRGAAAPGAGNGVLPAEAKIDALQDPVIAENGDVLVPVGHSGPKLSARRGSALFWSPSGDRLAPRIALRVGEELATMGGARIGAIRASAIHPGGVIFHAQLTGGNPESRITPGTDMVVGAWDVNGGMRMLVRDGQPLAGSTLKGFVVPLAGQGSPGQSRRWSSWPAGETPMVGLLGKLSDGNRVVFTLEEGQTETVLSTTRSGGPGQPDGTDETFRSYGLPIWDSTMTTPAFTAVLRRGQKGVFRLAGDVMHGEQYVGSDFAAGIRVKKLKDPILSPDSSVVVWEATLSGRGINGSNDQMLLERSGSYSSPAIVAWEGSQAADCPQGAIYDKFSSIAMNQQGVLVSGSLRIGRGRVSTADDECLWARSITGELRLILREKQPLDGKTLKKFQVLKAVPGSLGTTRAFTDFGHLVALGTFTDGSIGIIEVQLP